MGSQPPVLPDAESVPKDKYVPRWGLLLMCHSEQEHQQLYAELKERYPDHEVRAVSI